MYGFDVRPPVAELAKKTRTAENLFIFLVVENEIKYELVCFAGLINGVSAVRTRVCYRIAAIYYLDVLYLHNILYSFLIMYVFCFPL